MTEYIEYDWRSHIIESDLKKPYKNFTAKDREVAIKAFREVIQKSDDYDLMEDLMHQVLTVLFYPEGTHQNTAWLIDDALVKLKIELKSNMDQNDEILQKFLYARKFHLNESFELYKNYYWFRKRHPEIFRQLTLETNDIRKALKNGLPGVLKDKDRKGRCVLLLTGNNWDCSYSLVSIYRAMLFSLDHLTNDLHNQANGFVVIVDWTEFSYRQTSQLKPSILRLMIEGLQDCYPARFKGIHFIGQPWYVDAALRVTKPFLKEEVKERIYAHGNNLSTLHELVHRDVLPAELGGEKPSYNPSSFLETLEQNNNPNHTGEP